METSSEKYENDKKDFLCEHYAYEVEMFEYSYLKLLQLSMIFNQNEQNLALDDFAIHTRNLLNFYTNYGNYQDDAKANDFLNDSIDWEQLAKKEIDNINRLDTRIKVNKQLAHLSYERINYEKQKKEWNAKEISDNILSITILFIENVDKKYITPKLQEIKDLITNNPYLLQK